MYNNAQIVIKMDQTGPTFGLHRGVKQGDPLSPNLFNAVLEGIFTEIDWETMGW